MSVISLLLHELLNNNNVITDQAKVLSKESERLGERSVRRSKQMIYYISAISIYP